MGPMAGAGASAVFCLETELSSRWPELHTHTNHELFYCAGARGWQRVAEGDVPMERGDFFLFPAGRRHIGAADPGAPCTALVINVHETFYDPASAADGEVVQIIRYLCRRAAHGQYRAELTPSTSARIRELFYDCLTEHAAKEPGYLAQEKAIIAQIFLAILRDPNHIRALQQNLPSAGPRERIDDVCRYIEANYMNHVEVDDVAGVAHMSRSHFHALFRRQTGQTLLEYVTAVRVRHAAALLRESGMPIAQVASACGFPCLSHFYHMFGKATGQTPSTVRKGRVPA